MPRRTTLTHFKGPFQSFGHHPVFKSNQMPSGNKTIRCLMAENDENERYHDANNFSADISYIENIGH